MRKTNADIYYWPPEVKDIDSFNARSESFMLGVLFYQLVEGKMPFGDDSSYKTLNVTPMFKKSDYTQNLAGMI